MTKKVFFAAVNTGFVSREGPSSEAIRFYAERSGHGLHSAIVGNVVLPEGHGSNDVCMRISRAREWGLLANAIHERGALPGIQLSSAWAGYVGMRPFKVPRGADPLVDYRDVVQSLRPSDITTIFDDLHVGSQLAIDAGFRHLQLHAAHGYLFCLLTDQYLCRNFPQSMDQIQDWLSFLASQGVESSVRISLSSGKLEVDAARQSTVDALCALSADYIDVSDGYYNFDKHLIYPSKAEDLQRRHDATEFLARRFPNRHFILSGRAANVQSSGQVNVHLGLCRDLIANPDFLSRRESGCANKMKCHFYSTGQKSLSCALWKSEG